MAITVNGETIKCEVCGAEATRVYRDNFQSVNGVVIRDEKVARCDKHKK